VSAENRSYHRYLPHTDADVGRMLEVIGSRSIADLFAQLIPPPLALGRKLDLPPPLDEASLLDHLQELARTNAVCGRTSFLGAGVHPHAIQSAVDMLIQRSEFYTSYTPYQPEISQGTLQVIFEFQTMVSELLGLGLANASMYDGSTATAEAVLMARRLTGRKRALASLGVHPEYRRVVSTYLAGLDAQLEPLALGRDGRTEAGPLASDVGCLVVQVPNFFGVVEDIRALAQAAHAAGALLLAVTTEPLAFGLLAPPGALGADIAVGEGIGLAIPPSLGGPGLGLFASRDEPDFRKALPGRLVGETVDRRGRRGYVLTLATREQHIRREKATSNICTNQGLMALASNIHMSLLGKEGLREVARQSHAKAEYLKGEIAKVRGYRLPYSGPTFNEFLVEAPEDASGLLARLATRGILGGVPLSRFDAADRRRFLVAVTEMNERTEMDRLVAALAGRDA